MYGAMEERFAERSSHNGFGGIGAERSSIAKNREGDGLGHPLAIYQFSVCSRMSASALSYPLTGKHRRKIKPSTIS